MVALSALAAVLAVLWMPVGLIEMVVASSGLSEAVPAAAPPLGMTARLALAGFAGLMAAGAVGLTRRTPDENRDRLRDARAVDGEIRRDTYAQGAKTMGFAFSKLTALARGRAVPVSDAPSLRRADAHPDAPPRPPIFASRDFDGVEIFARPESGRRPLVVSRETEPTPAAPFAPVEPPLAGPAFLRPAAPFIDPVEPQDEEPEEIIEALWDETFAPAPQPSIMAHDEPPLTPLPLRMPTHGLSVHELTERLERGLAQRQRTTVAPRPAGGMIADMPVAAPVPVRENVARDTDEALRAALGALRSMTGRR